MKWVPPGSTQIRSGARTTGEDVPTSCLGVDRSCGAYAKAVECFVILRPLVGGKRAVRPQAVFHQKMGPKVLQGRWMVLDLLS